MNALVFEHVPVADLPPAWRARLAQNPGATVTVRIEADIETASADDQNHAMACADDPLFGMWRDREDMADVADYVRAMRADRFSDGTAGQAPSKG